MQDNNTARRASANLDALFESDEKLIKKELLVEMEEDAGTIAISNVGIEEDPDFEDHWNGQSDMGMDHDDDDDEMDGIDKFYEESYEESEI